MRDRSSGTPRGDRVLLRYCDSIDVGAARMAYRSCGTGPPIVMLHGNPTSSYLWRDVAPLLAELGTVVTPDLIGMGRSSRPRATLGPSVLTAQATWLEHFLDALLHSFVPSERSRLVLVGHDWGGTLATDWATRNPSACTGVAWTEATVRPRQWSEEPPEGRRLFRRLRSAEGHRLVLEDNSFVEDVLFGALPELTDEERAAHRAASGPRSGDRRMILDLVRAIPFDGDPASAHSFVSDLSARLEVSTVPKLFVEATPGAVLRGNAAAWCAALPATTHAVVRAGHFVPEEAPVDLARHLRDWLISLR